MHGYSLVCPMENRTYGQKFCIFHLPEWTFNVPCASAGRYNLIVRHIASVSEQSSFPKLFLPDYVQLILWIWKGKEYMIVLFEDFVLKYIIHIFTVIQDFTDCFRYAFKGWFLPFLSSPFERFSSFPCISKSSDFVFSILICIPCNCPFSSSGLYTITVVASLPRTVALILYVVRDLYFSGASSGQDSGL